jgi:hypothetical protein
MRERLLAASLLLLAATGCRGRDAQAPTATTIEEAERQLADNRRALEAAGISVPSATVAVAPGPPPEPEGDGEGADEPDDEGGGETEPIEEAPQPEPAPEIYDQPTYAEDAPGRAPRAESDDAYEAQDEDTRTVGSSVRERRRSRKSRRKQATRCERMCELAEATCDLQLQICALAERHATDVRYDRACQQAQLQCDAAARECERCEI